MARDTVSPVCHDSDKF